MTRRRGRARVLRGLAGVVVATALVMPAAPALASVADVSERASEAFAQISSCIADRGSLLASIVVDDSASLKASDPQDRRADAVVAIVDSLAELERSGAGGVTVEANLAVFGSKFEEVLGWGPPSGAHGDQLRQAAGNRLRNRLEPGVMAQRTDYREALRGAQSALDQRASALDQPPCSLVLWFTDGRLDVDFPAPVGGASEAARDEICRAGGIIDGVRAAGTHVLALALFSDSPEIPEADRVTEREREQLRAVAESSAGAETCGSDPRASGGAQGAYLHADDPGQLRRLFAGTGALMQGATPGGSSRPNVDGRIEIPVDQAIGAFRMIFEVEDGAHGVLLESPGGTAQVDVLASRAAPAGNCGDQFCVESSGREGLYVATVTRGSRSLAGTWALVADSDAVRLLDLYYFWGAELEVLPPADGLVVGREATVLLQLRHGGDRDDRDWYSDVTVSLAIDGGESRPAVDNGDGTWAVTVEVPEDGARTAMRFDALASAVTTEGGLRLGPISTTATLPTQLPVGFPNVTDPAMLDFGRFAHDQQAAEAHITLQGSDEGPTRVCFPAEPTWHSAPETAQFVLDVRAEADGCVTLTEGETREVVVGLSAGAPSEGQVSGAVQAVFHGANTDETHTQSIPIEGSMFRPVDESARWTLVALFTALALLVAWAVAAVVRDLVYRYRLDRPQMCSVPLLVFREGPERDDLADVSAGFITHEDFRSIGRVNARRFSLGDLRWARRGAWWRPYKPYTGIVSASGGCVVTATPGGSVGQLDARSAPVEFPGTQHAYVVAEQQDLASDRPVRARLILLVESDRGSIAHRVDQWSADLAVAGSGTVLHGIDWSAVDARIREGLAVSAGASADDAAQTDDRKPRRSGRRSEESPQRDVPPDTYRDEPPAPAPAPAPDPGPPDYFSGPPDYFG